MTLPKSIYVCSVLNTLGEITLGQLLMELNKEKITSFVFRHEVLENGKDFQYFSRDFRLMKEFDEVLCGRTEDIVFQTNNLIEKAARVQHNDKIYAGAIESYSKLCLKPDLVVLSTISEEELLNFASKEEIDFLIGVQDKIIKFCNEWGIDILEIKTNDVEEGIKAFKRKLK